MANRDTSVSELCTQLGTKPATLYRYVEPRASCASRARRSSPTEPECLSLDDDDSPAARSISLPQPDRPFNIFILLALYGHRGHLSPFLAVLPHTILAQYSAHQATYWQ